MRQTCRVIPLNDVDAQCQETHTDILLSAYLRSISTVADKGWPSIPNLFVGGVRPVFLPRYLVMSHILRSVGTGGSHQTFPKLRLMMVHLRTLDAQDC